MPQDSGRPKKGSAFGMGTALGSTEPALLTWRSSLYQRKPKKFAMGLAIAVLGLFVLWFGFRDDPAVIGVLVIALVLVTGALAPAFFPIEYRLTPKRVQQRILFSVDSYRWADFDHYFMVEDGVFLHLEPRDLRQKYLRGVTLYFARDNRDRVLDTVRQFVAEQAAHASDQERSPKK